MRAAGGHRQHHQRCPRHARRTGLIFVAALTAAACGSSGDVKSASTVTSSGATATLPVESTTTAGLRTTNGPSTPAGSPTTPQPTTTTTPADSASSDVARSGDLTVTLTVSPAQASSGAAMQFTIAADETAAHGALAYRLTYGDGATDQNVVAQYCLGGAGAPQTQQWQLTHRYASAGRYSASVTVTANCTPDRATATVPVVIT